MSRCLVDSIEVITDKKGLKSIEVKYINGKKKKYPYSDSNLTDIVKETQFNAENINYYEKDKPKKIKLVIYGVCIIVAVTSSWYIMRSLSNRNGLSKDSPYNGGNVTTPPSIVDDYDKNKKSDTYKDFKETLKKEENHFDKFDIEEIKRIVFEVQNQISKSEGLVVSNEDLLAMTLLANNVDPGEANLFENIVKPLAAIMNINVIGTGSIYSGVTSVNNERVPLNLDLMFANKKDRAFVSLFISKREALIDAIYEGNKDLADEMAKEYFLLQCKALKDEKPVLTKEGMIAIESVSTMAKFTVTTMSLCTNAIFGGIDPNYSLAYDAVKDLNSDELEEYNLPNLIDTLNNNNRVYGTILLKQLDKGMLEKFPSIEKQNKNEEGNCNKTSQEENQKIKRL